MKKNIALVMGGFSGEHQISINSGCQVYDSLDKQKYNVYKIVIGGLKDGVIDRNQWYWLADDGTHRPVDRADFSVVDKGEKVLFDLAFIIIHGNPGENGVMQGYFDLLGIKYSTCGFYTSALTFNKGYCNAVVRGFDVVHVADSYLVYGDQPFEEKTILEHLGLPLFVKPASGGSSVATTKVKKAEDLLPAIREALTEDSAVLVEQFVKGREFDCGILKASGKKFVFPITEIIPLGGHEFFDYAAKYDGFSNEVTPAEVEPEIAEEIQEISSRLYDLLDCRGVVRFDYIYDTDKSRLTFLEVNTIPGQSAESIVPKQARAMGISTSKLYEMIIEDSLNR
ncbi:MAG: D-alanine--D-alanine ligase [Bacteroidales bacterium]|nr:D-alanine--D-alanine ligase [Bacteroidales bacterium]